MVFDKSRFRLDIVVMVIIVIAIIYLRLQITGETFGPADIVDVLNGE